MNFRTSSRDPSRRWSIIPNFGHSTRRTVVARQTLRVGAALVGGEVAETGEEVQADARMIATDSASIPGSLSSLKGVNLPANIRERQYHALTCHRDATRRAGRQRQRVLLSVRTAGRKPRPASMASWSKRSGWSSPVLHTSRAEGCRWARRSARDTTALSSGQSFARAEILRSSMNQVERNVAH